jgi:hypothetical protein
VRCFENEASMPVAATYFTKKAVYSYKAVFILICIVLCTALLTYACPSAYNSLNGGAAEVYNMI